MNLSIANLNLILNFFSKIEKETKSKEKEARVNLICDSALVIVTGSNRVDSEYDFDLQTFRIDRKTTFKILKESIHNFWQVSENKDEYSLFMLENNSQYAIRENDEFENNMSINAFLKSRPCTNKAQFLYIHNSKLGKKFNFQCCLFKFIRIYMVGSEKNLF